MLFAMPTAGKWAIGIFIIFVAVAAVTGSVPLHKTVEVVAEAVSTVVP